MKLCAFGNSYMIAIKQAIEDSSLNGSVTFVGASAGRFSMSVTDEVVIPGPGAMLSFAQGNGPDILLSDYDAFLIVGLGLGFQHAAKIYTRHRLWQHGTEDSYVVSEKALHAAIMERLAADKAFDFARILRQHTDKPLFFMPQPNPVEAIKTMPLNTDRLRQAHERWQVFFQDEVGTAIYGAFVRAAEAIARDLSAKFIPQPTDTLTPVFSDNLYRVEFKPKFTPLPGGPRPPEEDDIFHLNPAYGHRMLKQLEPLLTPAWTECKNAIPQSIALPL